MSLFFPAAKPQPVRIVEAGIGDFPLVDPDDGSYRRLGSAPRDLVGVTLFKAMNLSVMLYRANPLANRIISIYRSFLAGKGFSVTATNPEVQAILDDFWTGPRNRLDRNHKDYTRDFLLFGEGHHPWAFDETGNATVGFIDPTSVDRIKRSPTNAMILDEIRVQMGLYSAETVPLKVVAVGTDPLEDDAGLYTGQVSTWLFDRIAASSRGTPFLMPSLDWLDAYDQVLWELLERQKALRAHFWRITVAGGDPEVQKAKKLFGTVAPRTGSVQYVTDAMNIEAVTPDLGSSEDVAAATYQLRHIATGAGLAPHWLGEPEDANRSTAEQMDIPVLRSLADTQDEWVMNTRELCSVAVDAKVRATLLDSVLPAFDEQGQEIAGSDKPARDHIKIQPPEIEEAKVELAATSLAAVANAFVQLDLLGAVGAETISKVIRQMLPALGVPAEELPDELVDDPDGTARRDADMLEAWAHRARRLGSDDLAMR